MKKRGCATWVLALLAFAVPPAHTHAQSIYTPYAFTNFAGNPCCYGTNDGPGSAARFSGPWGVAVDGSGNIYVADADNQTLRKITAGGMVTTLAGTAGQIGSADGVGSAARFRILTGVAADTAANLYVADLQNCTIRKITPAGVVTTWAGTAGLSGTNDGTGSAARFRSPSGVAVDNATNVYVADRDNFTIRKITPARVVTTLAGSPDHRGASDGTGSAARFDAPGDLAVDSAGNVYVADMSSGTIRKITPAGVVTTLAGSASQYGSADGTGTAARFNQPSGVTVDSAGNVYVADWANFTIRKITAAGVVTTLAGCATCFMGSADGVGGTARFSYPAGVAVDSAGNLYVADANNRITKGTPAPRLQFDTNAGSLTASNGSFHARLIGPSGSSAVVEASTSLQSWTPIQTNALPSGGLYLSVAIGTNRQQFFRARLAP